MELAAEHVFDVLSARNSQPGAPTWRNSVRVSWYQIVDEVITDLLATAGGQGRAGLKMRDDPRLGVVVRQQRGHFWNLPAVCIPSVAPPHSTRVPRRRHRHTPVFPGLFSMFCRVAVFATVGLGSAPTKSAVPVLVWSVACCARACRESCLSLFFCVCP